MTYKDVVLTIAGLACCLVVASTAAQDNGSALTATIDNKGGINAGADWIAKVSRANDAYNIVFTTPFKNTPDCTVSLTANASRDRGEMVEISSESTTGMTVQTWYVDSTFHDMVFWALPFDLKCIAGEEEPPEDD
jgi:hypothetical protein